MAGAAAVTGMLTGFERTPRYSMTNCVVCLPARAHGATATILRSMTLNNGAATPSNKARTPPSELDAMAPSPTSTRKGSAGPSDDPPMVTYSPGAMASPPPEAVLAMVAMVGKRSPTCIETVLDAAGDPGSLTRN